MSGARLVWGLGFDESKGKTKGTDRKHQNALIGLSARGSTVISDRVTERIMMLLIEKELEVFSAYSCVI